jgi:uncharacterized protein (TIRG00374 family)
MVKALNKTRQIILNVFISLILFAAIFYLVGFDRIYGVLLSARPEFFLMAIGMYIVVTLLMAFRIKVVLGALKERLSLFQTIPPNLAGLLASDFTPARVGYFFSAFSLSSSHNIRLEKTISAIFGPQLFDFMIKAISAAILTALIVSKAGAGGILINIVIILAAFFAITFASLLVFWPPMLQMLSPLEKMPLIPRVFAFLRGMHEHSESIWGAKWPIIGITALSWMAKGLEWYLLSRVIGIVITGDMASDILFMMVFQGAITIIQFVPSPTIAGAGASEAAFAIILLPFGVPFGTSVAFGFLTRLTMIVVDAFSLPVIVGYLHRHSVEGTLDKLLKFEH